MTVATQPNIDTPVGQIVAERPQTARLFEQLSIDYCCHGKETLAEASRGCGLDPGAVLRLLLSQPATPADDAEVNWRDASLSALADHIEQTHHAYLLQELPRLEAMVRKVAAVHGQRHLWLLELDSVYAGFAASMHSHLLQENQALFPLIRAMERAAKSKDAAQPAVPTDLGDPLEVFEHEHDDAGRSLERMRSLSDDYTPPADACNTFRLMLDGLKKLEMDTHRHVHLENSILFPGARKLGAGV